MDESRRRLAHLRDDPRVALTVLGKDDWSRHVSLTGRVASLEDRDRQLARVGRSAALDRLTASPPSPGAVRERS